jgi:hypothetical protein
VQVKPLYDAGIVGIQSIDNSTDGWDNLRSCVSLGGMYYIPLQSSDMGTTWSPWSSDLLGLVDANKSIPWIFSCNSFDSLSEEEITEATKKICTLWAVCMWFRWSPNAGTIAQIVSVVYLWTSPKGVWWWWWRWWWRSRVDITSDATAPCRLFIHSMVWSLAASSGSYGSI